MNLISMVGEPTNTTSNLEYCNNPQYSGGIKTELGEVYLDFCPSAHETYFIVSGKVFDGAVVCINDETCEFKIDSKAVDLLKSLQG